MPSPYPPPYLLCRHRQWLPSAWVASWVPFVKAVSCVSSGEVNLVSACFDRVYILKYPKLIQSPGLFFEVKNISLDSHEDLISAEHVGSKHIKTTVTTSRPLPHLPLQSHPKAALLVVRYIPGEGKLIYLSLPVMLVPEAYCNGWWTQFSMSWWLRPYLDCRQLGRLQVEENTQRNMCSMAAVDTWCLMILVHSGIKHDQTW